MLRIANKCHIALRLATRSVWRRASSFYPLWMAFAFSTVILILLDSAGRKIVALDRPGLMSAMLGLSETDSIYRGFLFVGLFLCISQSQLLVLRTLREEKRYLIQLIEIGIHPGWVLFSKVLEYIAHSLVGAIVGTLLGAIFASCFLSTSVGLENLFQSLTVILLSVPTTLLWLAYSFWSHGRRNNVIM